MCFAAVRDRKRLRPIFQRVKAQGTSLPARITSSRNSGLNRAKYDGFQLFSAVFEGVSDIICLSPLFLSCPLSVHPFWHQET